MAIIISDLFKTICTNEFGITARHAIEAIGNRDKVEIIRVDDLTLRISSKHITLTRPPSYLLIIENVLDEKDSRIDFAVKIYPTLASNIHEKTPLEILEIFANRFGVDIHVGQIVAKFILQQKIPIKDKQDIYIAEVDENPSSIQQFYIKLEPGIPLLANCAICYCINMNKYLPWLASKGSRI